MNRLLFVPAIVLLMATTARTSFASAAPATMTQDSGAPVGDNQDSKTAGQDGPVVLEDFALIEKLAHFDRERIPERVVHARGVGAMGTFVASTDWSAYSKASLFAQAGKSTPVLVRFSTVMNYRGSPEAARDPRGFAVKFYTDQGNWDLVGINLPVFFIRDAIKFPDFVHANKPDPVTNFQDPRNAFDFFSNSPEATHMLTYLYSDTYGMPVNYREMDGFGVHAFRMVNAKGESTFVKFHWKSRQGVHGMTSNDAHSADTNYATRDLYAAIGAGHFPQWDLYVQILSAEQVAKLSYDGFDDTKVWTNLPEQKIGTLTLNKLPGNYFQDIEESAFAPGVMVPGIEPSPDKMLQGRLFAYADTQRYRLGVNYQQLPINRPLVDVHNDHQDGLMNSVPRTGHVNYQPTSRDSDPGATTDDTRFEQTAYPVDGLAAKRRIAHPENFAQAGELWRAYSPTQQEAVIGNLSADLRQVTDMHTRLRMVSYFYKADPGYGTRLAKASGSDLAVVQRMAAALSD